MTVSGGDNSAQPPFPELRSVNGHIRFHFVEGAINGALAKLERAAGLEPQDGGFELVLDSVGQRQTRTLLHSLRIADATTTGLDSRAMPHSILFALV